MVCVIITITAPGVAHPRSLVVCVKFHLKCAGVVNFGEISSVNYHLLELIPMAIVGTGANAVQAFCKLKGRFNWPVGLLGGLLAALFIYTNTRINRFRRDYTTSRKLSIAEVTNMTVLVN